MKRTNISIADRLEKWIEKREFAVNHNQENPYSTFDSIIADLRAQERTLQEAIVKIEGWRKAYAEENDKLFDTPRMKLAQRGILEIFDATLALLAPATPTKEPS